MFKMKPYKGFLISASVVLLIGILYFYEAHRDPGDIPAQHRGHLVLAISVVVSGLLLIIATGRLWFGHLWHDRYR